MNENLEMTEIFEDVSNPLDSVEDIISGQDWVFDRPNPEELPVTVGGREGMYRMTFIWQEEFSAMQFFCEMDMTVPESRLSATAKALQTINARLWLGHFVVQEHNRVPCFRHTSMFRGWTHTSGAEHVEDLVDISLAECERFYGLFTMLAGTADVPDSALDLALAESAGQA